ncbi:MAG: ATP-binding cassette domain-containing protein [Methanoregula sp.]|nr:ATP-binding cassette domain-containing protein [Methanoregula sp.]
MNAIETHDLTRYYGARCAVNHLTLSVDREVFALLGPNGSGKTTTVLMLTTMLHPTEGTATVCGHDILRDGEEVRRSLSYVPQDMAVDIKLTGRENALLFARLYGTDTPKDRVDELLAVMQLFDRADDLVKTYSGGMRRRLELVQALVHKPEVLFLDEPTLGLDVAARATIWEHITALKKDGMTIFVTTHYMDEADRFCDRVGIISNGSLLALDAPSSLKARLSNDVITAHIDGTFRDPGVDGITLFSFANNEASFLAENGREALPLLADAFTRAGVRVRSLALREPTLDDVFLHTVGKSEEPAGFDQTKFRTMLRRRK